MRIESENTHRCWHTKCLLIVGMPLPLQAEVWSIKLITLYRIHLHFRVGFWHSILIVRRSTIAFLWNNAHYRPVVFPSYRLQMYNSAIGTSFLEMQKPILTIFSMYPSTLMRTIDVALSLRHHLHRFIRSIRRLTSHRHLKSFLNSTGREHNPIPAITLIELWSFAGAVLCSIAIKNDNRIANSLSSFSI